MSSITLILIKKKILGNYVILSEKVLLLSLLRRCWLWDQTCSLSDTVGADGLIATLSSKRRANKTLFGSQYKKSHKRNTYDR